MIQENQQLSAFGQNQGSSSNGTVLHDAYSGVICQLESHARSQNRNSLIVGMTNAIPRLGVSRLIEKLGDFCSESLNRRTLLIDFTSANEEDVDVSKAGFWDLVCGDAEIDELIGGGRFSRVAQMRPGTPNASVNFNSTRDAFNKLRKRFDIILVNLPSSSHMLNGVAVDEMLDSVILVVQAGTTGKQEYRTAVDRLTARNVQFGGVVLDKVENDMPTFDNLPADIIDMMIACVRFLKTAVIGLLKAGPWTLRKVFEACRRQR